MTEIAPRIVVDETVRFGKPVIAGTRSLAELERAKKNWLAVAREMNKPIPEPAIAP